MKEYSTVPAAPGYFACGPIVDDRGSLEGIHEDPIVAWLVMNVPLENALDGKSYAVPVGFETLGEVSIIKTPDGKYSDLLSGLHGLNEYEALEVFDKQVKRKKK